MMLLDAHAHLNDPALTIFIENLSSPASQSSMLVISNSVDYQSSLANLRLHKKIDCIKPFVGIHPEIFGSAAASRLNMQELDLQISKIEELLPGASGIGEIGLDPKYGEMDLQEYLFQKMLDLAESTRLPLTIHSRNSISRILELLSTRHIKGSILFHWFAGTDSELRRIQGDGNFVSFGPSIIFSRRLGTLASSSTRDLFLAETDAPTMFEGIEKNVPSTSYLVSSVVFKIALLRNISFEDSLEILYKNGMRYLQTQD